MPEADRKKVGEQAINVAEHIIGLVEEATQTYGDSVAMTGVCLAAALVVNAVRPYPGATMTPSEVFIQGLIGNLTMLRDKTPKRPAPFFGQPIGEA
jgi:uncharacterized radical SAM superfamily protein